MNAMYQWLADQHVFQGFAGTLMVAIVVPLTGWFVTRVSASRNMTTFNLRIQIPEGLQGMRFVVRHVRDGAGAPPLGAQSYKEDKPFPKPRPDQLTTQTLTFPRHVGALFKVYVEHGDMDFDEVKRILESAGYTDVSRDGGPKRNRAWFILPDHATVKHGNIIDNFYLD